MAVQFEWCLGPMKTETVNGISDVVTNINYSCLARDLETNAVGSKNGSIPVPSPDPNNFITLDNLTSSILQGWINQGIQKAEIELECSKLLEQELAPPASWVDISSSISDELRTNLSTPGFVPFAEVLPPLTQI